MLNDTQCNATTYIHIVVILSTFYAHCRTKLFMLCVIILNVIILHVIMLNVIILNAIMQNVIMQNVIMQNVIMQNVVMLNVMMLIFVVPKNTSSEARKMLQIMND